jgi:hypothetical protein
MAYLIPAVLLLLIAAVVVTVVVVKATGRRDVSPAKGGRKTAGEADDRDVPDSERLANRPR